MSDRLLFLDVNVPMYAAGKAHPYKKSCVWILTEVAHGRLEVVIDTQIIQEILYRFGALEQWQVGVQMAENLLDLIPNVLPITAGDIRKCVTLFAHYAPQGVKARDLLHAAVMQNHQITHIISTDKHFDLVKGITRLDPRDLSAEE